MTSLGAGQACACLCAALADDRRDDLQRIQKALVQMNLQLPLVVSDITGVTGLRILRDIASGQRDPAQSGAPHRDRRCRATQAKIEAA